MKMGNVEMGREWGGNGEGMGMGTTRKKRELTTEDSRVAVLAAPEVNSIFFCLATDIALSTRFGHVAAQAVVGMN